MLGMGSLSLLIHRYSFFLAFICARNCVICPIGVSYILVFDDFVDCLPIMSIYHLPAPSVFCYSGSKI